MTTSNDPDQKQRRNLRAILTVIAVAAMFGGGLLLLRVYFLELRDNSGSALVSDELPGQDNRRQINGVSTEPGSNQEVWGDQLTNIYQLPSNNPWVVVTEAGVITVGEIAKDKFVPKFTVPGAANDLWVYQNGYLSYTTPSTNIDRAQLKLVDLKQQQQVVVTLSSGWDFSGVTFNVLDRSFYYARTNSRGKIAVEKVVPGQAPIQLFVVSAAQLKLVAVPSKNVVELIDESTQECEELSISDKLLKSKDCSSLHWGIDKFNYGLTKFDIATYDPKDVHRSYRVEAGKTVKETITKAKEGQIFSLGSKFGDQISYLVTEVSQNELGVLVTVPKYLEVFRLGTSATTKVEVEELMLIEQAQVWSKGIITIIERVDSKNQLSVHLPEAEAGETWVPVTIPACEIGCQIEFINTERILYEI